MVDGVLELWEKDNTFQKSLDTRSDDRNFRFYDGPPFASGDPHYGHLLVSSIKDIVARYVTMKWYKVYRKWWWDCHGLPVENQVEKILGVNSKKEIEEKVGIDKFTTECKNYVNNVNDNWKRFISRIGRWVDIDNAYFTMDQSYMESVIHIFSELYKDNLIFKWFKIQGYCPRCSTTLSNYEINEGYADKQDKAVTVKFQLQGDDTKNSTTEDGMTQVVCGVISDKDWKKLMIYHQKENLWFFPGGKAEKWENLETALDRELKEELGVETTSKEYIWAIKIIHLGTPYQVNYFDVEVGGEPKVQETDKHTALKWVEKIESDNELGFAVKMDNNIIDEEWVLQREFIDYYLFEKVFKNPELDQEKLANGDFNILAWTTTPWTLPSNMFLAVGEDIDYITIFDKEAKEYYTLAEKLVKKYYKNADDYVFIYRMKGKELAWINFKPLFDFYRNSENIESKYKEETFKILTGDFVSTEDGTGVVHIAPWFGEDDFNAVSKVFPKADARKWLFLPIDEFGNFTSDVTTYDGQYVFDANEKIIQDLKWENRIVKIESLNHSYPHCRRCDTPLMYRAIDSRFVNEPSQKDLLLKETDKLNFVPAPIKKRFVNIIASAPDWNISRNRYWGSPLPVWECDCGERLVLGSKAEIEKHSGQEVKDLHRPHIDEITIDCKACGWVMHRIEAVLDCWFESGSMPFAQDHYPFAKEELNYPADFITESLDQTRGWFRGLHVLGTLFKWETSYKNVVVSGMILAEDGKKMSKKLKNYPDPKHLFDQYGSDSFRTYVLSGPIVKWEPLRFDERWVEQVLKSFLIPMENATNFLTTYAKIDGYKHPWTQAYFMRHGKTPTNNNERLNDCNIDESLDESTIGELEDKAFVDSVLSMNIDMIYSSNLKRAKETAEKVAAIVKKYTGKDIKIIEKESMKEQDFGEFSGKLHSELYAENPDCPRKEIPTVYRHNNKEWEKWDEFVDRVEKSYKEILEEAKWKKVLIVSHGWVLKALWQAMYNMSMEEIFASLSFKPKNLEISRLPLVTVTNDTDKWILAELNATIKETTDYLEKYFLDNAVNAAKSFVDKLTNWYIRRSRRRFWASGMDADKLSGYYVYWEVMEQYLRLISPIIPFLSEDLYQKILSLQEWYNGEFNSIHLEYWPCSSKMYINTELQEEIKMVRKIISMALYIRAKNKVKIKQPLSRISVKID